MTLETLQLARLEDYDSINALSRQVLELHAAWCPEEYQTAEAVYPRELYLELIREKLLYAAWLDGNIVGYVRFQIWQTNGAGAVNRKVLDIDDIGVEESRRNQGIGKKIMSDLQSLARDLGCTHIQLYAAIQNENAIAFYQKCGFRVRNLGMGMKL